MLKKLIAAVMALFLFTGSIYAANYTELERYSEGLAAAKIQNKWGYVDANKKIVIPAVYADAEPFSQGLAAVSKYVNGREKYGYIDKTGKVVIDFIYDDADEFYNGYAKVEVKGVDKWISHPIHPPKQTTTTAPKNDATATATKTQNANTAPVQSVKPVQPKTPTAPSKTDVVTAKAAVSNVTVNGRKVETLEIYTIGGNNYFKLRDLAYLANETGDRFSVEWDGTLNAIVINDNKFYTPIGTELQGGDGKDKQARRSVSKFYLIDDDYDEDRHDDDDNEYDDDDRHEYSFEAYLINGSTYFKLRDLAAVLDFDVEWNNRTKTIHIDMD